MKIKFSLLILDLSVTMNLFILEDRIGVFMYRQVLSGTLHGVEGTLITVEADVSEGLPVFNMVGYKGCRLQI